MRCRIYDKQGRADIDQELVNKYCSSFLKTGDTQAIFNLSEKILVFQEGLKIFIKGLFISM